MKRESLRDGEHTSGGIVNTVTWLRTGVYRRWAMAILAGLVLCVLAGGSAELAWSAEEDEPKSNRMVCGECPEGYATTGTTSAPSICKEDDHILVQCVPLGSKLLSVCGECPDGYSRVGSSNVPSRCGTEDGGLMSQCQREGS